MSAANINSLGTTAKRAQKPLFDRLFGYDYFIAHRSSDGKPYARALHERLTRLPTPFRCFIDRHDYSLGGDIPRMQTAALRKSTRLIVIVTASAHLPPSEGQDWLLGEVREFKASRGAYATIVPIGTTQTLDPFVWPESTLLREVPHLPHGNCVLEAEESCLSVAPSDETVARLILDFSERRQERTRLRVFQSLAASLAVLLVTATALGIIAHFQRQHATRNEHRARVSKIAAEGIVDDMLRDLGDKLEAIGKLELLENVTSASENYFARMDPELRDAETEIHAALAALTSGHILRQKGDHDAARTQYSKAETQLTRLVSDAPQDARIWRDLGTARGSLALLSQLEGNLEANAEWLRKTSAAMDEAIRLQPEDFSYRRETLLIRARLLALTQTKPALPGDWDMLIDSARQLAVENPTATNLRLISFLYAGAAKADEQRGDLDGAASRLMGASQLIFDLEKYLPDDAEIQLDLADCLRDLAFLEKRRGKMKEAISALEAAENISRSMRQRDPLNQEWLGLHAQLLSVFADLLFGAGEEESAFGKAREAATLLRAIQERHPATKMHSRNAALTLVTLGYNLAKASHWEEGTAAWIAATDMLERLAALGGLTPDQEVTLAITYRSRAEAALAKTHPELKEARDCLSKALDRLRQLHQAGKLPDSANGFIVEWEKRQKDLSGE